MFICVQIWIPSFESTDVSYSFLCKDCNTVYIEETGLFYNVQLQENKCTFKSSDLYLKLVYHIVETGRISYFGDNIIIKSNCINKRDFS